MLENFKDFLLNGENLLFIFFSMLVIIGAVFLINLQKVVHMVIALATTFISLAGLYVLLEAEFLAFVQVLIYAGAMTILMIFGIMMTKHDRQNEEPKRPLHNGLLLLGSIGFFFIIYLAIQEAAFPIQEFTSVEENTELIGIDLFTWHVIPFELVSVLLTVAFIGAIIVAKREED
ncbi:NADH-quinone oxidoreductase subunit J [Chengkuizengella axinellae]|uniref:NADH-quinone oxidoreductase subunit J n=1 Tax=Chengkuizengella axinellae TaxID=3064388 RepID=A0ABT9J5E1_9BACL|nr:NADH-quinone oxidoreductase subunit J [Chengkuizengella sp. 2205SS18-9]MDP5276836.1 NADH-quinone oxidoreductase subunit J [Chengkuizengella sp. 2205SS18-9]